MLDKKPGYDYTIYMIREKSIKIYKTLRQQISVCYLRGSDGEFF